MLKNKNKRVMKFSNLNGGTSGNAETDMTGQTRLSVNVNVTRQTKQKAPIPLLQKILKILGTTKQRYCLYVSL